MADIRVQKLGQLLVNYGLDLKAGERTLIRSGMAGMPLAQEIYIAVLEAGGHPVVWFEDDNFKELLLKTGNDEQVSYIPPQLCDMYETFETMVKVSAEENTRGLSNVDTRKQQLHEGARGEKLMKTFMERSAAGALRWTLAVYPTHAYAQDAEMSLREYEDFVYGACKLDMADPIAEWQKLHQFQAELIDYLKGKERVAVKGENVDLTLSIKDRTFINADGRANMPSGEIFTGPVENSVNGWVRYTYPAIYRGRAVEGVELRFEEGKVVKATAKKGEAYLNSVLDTDDGGRYLGEFAIGTNKDIQKFTGQILFDEKIGGTIHMAVGAAYPETGGVNESRIHWDMICDMKNGGQIWVDDELFYEGGRFVQFE